MLSEIQRNNYTPKAKVAAKELLGKLNINQLTDDNIGELQDSLDLNVSALVSLHEEGQPIDEELLKIYDLLTDIVLDNEEDLNFLNKLFFK